MLEHRVETRDLAVSRCVRKLSLCFC